MMFASLWVLALIIILLILASAFFSSAETALTAASDARMRQLASKGNARAQIVEMLRADRDGLIGSILIGNNAVNVLGSALATSVAISVFGESGLVWATIAMTVLLVVFAEVMPKTYAFTHADKFALQIAPAIRVVVRLISPLSLGIRLLASRLIRPPRQDENQREEELRGLIELQGVNGNADDRERNAMLSSILDLNALSVDQIMTHRGTVNMVNADDPIDDILRNVLSSPHTRLPVFSGKPDNIIGVLHVKDLLRALGDTDGKLLGATSQTMVQNIASDAYFIPETTLLFDQLQAFRARREHFAIV
ncbi:MAG: CNNM domain-containing protein, partial [Candidatus Puniceispirillum sp.]